MGEPDAEAFATAIAADPKRLLSAFSALEVSIVLTVHGFKGSRFQVPLLSPDCIWDAYLREKRQLHQA